MSHIDYFILTNCIVFARDQMKVNSNTDAVFIEGKFVHDMERKKRRKDTSKNKTFTFIPHNVIKKTEIIVVTYELWKDLG